MGMSDRQFDVHLQNMLRMLEQVKKEIELSGNSEMLENLINDIRTQLKRP